MKIQRNRVLEGVIARIDQFMTRFPESMAIDHDGTKGTLREGYVKDLIAQFLPTNLAVKSGFVTDSQGSTISPQLDLVVFDPTDIPNFSMSEFVTIAPVESVQCVIEVKSTLKTSDLDQIIRHQNAFRELTYAFTTPNMDYLLIDKCPELSEFIFAFESDCSLHTIREWFNEERGVKAICVAGRHILVRNSKDDSVEIIDSDGDHGEILHFLAKLHRLIVEERLEWTTYLKSVTEDPGLWVKV